MAKKKSASSARGKRVAKKDKPMPDAEIDFSDIPESTDRELKSARRVGRPKSGKPVRQLIAIRVDPKVLEKIRKIAKEKDIPYQSFIHQLLEKATKGVA